MNFYKDSFFNYTIWYIFNLYVILNFLSSAEASELGCPLMTITKVQRQILANLSDINLFGKKFHFSGKDNFDYDFVLCGDVNTSLPNASLLKTDKVQGTSEPIGYRNETSLAGNFGHGGWAVMSFAADRNITNNTSTCKRNTSTVMIVCDANQQNGEFLFLYEDPEYCRYVFELRIAAICGTPAGLSGFSIFIIIMVVFLILYFIAGILYNRIQLGAKGLDQIPHRNFWFGIGNAFADGCSVICRCDRCCQEPIEHLDSSGSYSGGYSPIGEGNSAGIAPSQSYERDAQLIRP